MKKKMTVGIGTMGKEERNRTFMRKEEIKTQRRETRESACKAVLRKFSNFSIYYSNTFLNFQTLHVS